MLLVPGSAAEESKGGQADNEDSSRKIRKELSRRGVVGRLPKSSGEAALCIYECNLNVRRRSSRSRSIDALRLCAIFSTESLCLS